VSNPTLGARDDLEPSLDDRPHRTRGRALAMTLRRLAAVASLAALAGPLAACGFRDDDGDGGSAATRERRTTTTRVEVVERQGDGREGFDAERIYEDEAPGVVTVVSVFDDAGVAGDGGGVGSGFVLNGDGEIATNAHVVTTGEVPDLRQAPEVYVEFADGNQVEAEVRGYDPDADIALLEVDPEGLTLRPLPLGTSADVEVGTPVAAIGSPFGERQSLSVGVVSAIDRSISSLTAFQIAGAIQTDAAINPGNSGGPLVNGAGEVIGVNQQIRTESGGGEGVGFAVPVDVARRSLTQLRERGEVRYAFIGVETVAIYPQLRERFDPPVGAGAWVQSVTADGPAEAAGIRGGDEQVRFQAGTFEPGGDVITRIDDEVIEEPDDLSAIVARLDPGQTVRVEAWRDGERRQLRLELGERPLSAPGGVG
jgi:S1-C subfamily serine protease